MDNGIEIKTPRVGKTELYDIRIRPQMDRYEALIERLALKKLKEIEKKILQGIKGLFDVQKSLEDLAPLAVNFDIDLQELSGILILATEFQKQLILSTFGGDIQNLRAFVALNFNLPPDPVRFKRALIERQEWLSKVVTDFTLEQTNTIIEQGIANGSSYKDMAERMKEAGLFDQKRAERIAKTEANRALNEATREYIEMLGVTHYRISPASSACKACLNLAKNIYPINEEVLPVHPNCKCSIVSVIPEDWVRKTEKEAQRLTKIYEVDLQKTKVFKGETGEKGDKGDTPKKGIDYLTDLEIAEMESSILSKISIPQPENGYTPQKGVDYFTKDEIEAIAKNIRKKIKLPKDGYSPKKGKDYFTSKDIEEIVSKIVKLIPNPITPSDVETIVKEVTDNKKYDINSIEGLKELIEDEISKIQILIQTPQGGGITSVAWGQITGTLSDQTDLQNVLNAKQDTLQSGVNIKTVNNESILGSGNIDAGAVDSVNGYTGIVVLDAADVGADTAGSAAAALVSANAYTDTGLLAKQDTLVSGTNIKTINGATILGSGDLVVAGASFWEKTVGSSGADYTTVKAATDAGFQRLLLITNVTETADVTCPSDLFIWGINRGITWNLDTHRLVCSSGVKINIVNMTVAHGNTGTGNAAITSGGDYIKMDFVTIDNNASSANKSLFGDASANKNIYINNCIWQGNVAFFMYLLGGATQVVHVNGFELIGEGTSATCIVLGANLSLFVNYKISGTFANTTGCLRMAGRFSNVTMDLDTPTNYGFILEGGSISNAYVEGIFRFAGSNTFATNIWFNNTIEFGHSSGQVVTVSDGHFTSAQTFSGGSGAVVKFVNCNFPATFTFQTMTYVGSNCYFPSTSSMTDTAYSTWTTCRFFGPHTMAGSNRNYVGCVFTANAHSITGDNHRFGDCAMESTVSTTSAADDLQFDNCYWVQATTFSGDRYQITNCRFANNVTIASTANLTRMVMCNYAGTITDSGTSTVIESPTYISNASYTLERTITANATADYRNIIFCDATAGNITLTLPAVANCIGRIYRIKRTDTSGNTVTLQANASENIDGANTYLLGALEGLVLRNDGTQWFVWN